MPPSQHYKKYMPKYEIPKSPLEQLAHKVQELEHKLDVVASQQSVLLYDFFYSNSDETINIPGSGFYRRLPRPGLFCVEKGQTVSIAVNASVNVVGSAEAYTEFEVRRNFVKLARAVQGDSTVPGNVSLMFKDTPDEDSEYEIRVRSVN